MTVEERRLRALNLAIGLAPTPERIVEVARHFEEFLRSGERPSSQTQAAELQERSLTRLNADGWEALRHLVLTAKELVGWPPAAAYIDACQIDPIALPRIRALVEAAVSVARFGAPSNGPFYTRAGYKLHDRDDIARFRAAFGLPADPA